MEILTYDVYQIFDEIDIWYKGKDGKRIYINNNVHDILGNLRELIKIYYNNEIVPMLFEYEFLK